MQDIFTRFIRGDLSNPIIQQAMAFMLRIQHENHFDPEVMQYPGTMLMQAFEKGTNRPLLYMPVHQVFMLEALGPNPDASEREVGMALAQMIKTLAWDAQVKGIGELHFPCTDESVIAFATHHHFMRMTHTVSVPADPPAGPNAQTEDKPAEVAGKPGFNIVQQDMPHLKFKVFK